MLTLGQVAGWCERLVIGASALLAIVSCDEGESRRAGTASASATLPTVAPSVTVGVPTAETAAATSGNAAKIDSRPPLVAPERRLVQREVSERLVIDTKGRWAPSCSIHRPCKVKPQALDICPPELNAEAWVTLADKAEHFTDPLVRVKGRLVMSDGAFSTAVRCEKQRCCNRRQADMVLAGPPYDLKLVGLGCAGDESRLCCAVSARGEEVIASGRLRYQTGRLLLESPTLCRTKTP